MKRTFGDFTKATVAPPVISEYLALLVIQEMKNQ